MIGIWYDFHVYCLSFTELTELLPTSGTGFVAPNLVLNAIKTNTALVSVMLANNETGVLQVTKLIFCNISNMLVNSLWLK